jgi:hypothetical protein
MPRKKKASLTRKLGKALFNAAFEEVKPKREYKQTGRITTAGNYKICRPCGGVGRLNGMKHGECKGFGYVR